MTIQELARRRDERFALVKAMRTVIDGADKANRDLNRDESQKVESLGARCQTLELEIQAGETTFGHSTQLVVGDEARLSADRTGHADRPIFGQEVRDLLTSPNTSGGYTVGTETANKVWANLRAESVVLTSGIRELRTNKYELHVPAVSGSAATSWSVEGELIAQTDMNFQGSIVRPTKLAAVLLVSRELIDDADADIIPLVEMDVAKSIALELDRAFLEGSGVVAEPLGLLGTTGIGTKALGAADGAAIKVDDVKQALDAVRVANGIPSSIFMHPKTWRDLTSITTGVASDLRYVLQSSMESPAEGFHPSLLGVPAYTTTQINAARTVGSTLDATNLYIVDNRHAAIVRREDMRIEISRDVFFQSDLVAIKAVVRVGFAFPQPAAHYALTAINLA